MTPIDRTPSKSEVLLQLAIAAYIPNPLDAAEQLRLRKGFQAIITAVRKLGGIPAADIDQFVQHAQARSGVEFLMIPAVLFATCLPDEDYFGAMLNSGMFSREPQARPACHPKFVEAMERLDQLKRDHGEEALNLPEHDKLWEQVFEFAPLEFLQVAHDEAVKLELLPDTKYVNDAGEPMYSAEQIAEKLGVPVEQVEKDIREKFGDRLPVGNVHRVQ